MKKCRIRGRNFRRNLLRALFSLAIVSVQIEISHVRIYFAGATILWFTFFTSRSDRKGMKINIISQLTGLTAHTLRYYEKIGLLKNIQRDPQGNRDYAKCDMPWIELIKRLKATRMPLAEIRRFADLREKGDPTIEARVEILEHHQRRIDEQIEQLKLHKQKIAEKIEICRQGGPLSSG